jgi:hypothetical protein
MERFAHQWEAQRRDFVRRSFSGQAQAEGASHLGV